MKSKLAITMIILSMAPTIAKAQTTAPQYFNLQSVLTDSGGNVLYDLQETNITFQIVDGGGEVYYTETQRVPVANGAISVLIGQGTNPSTGESTGGIPYDTISPEGDRYIRYQLEDDTIPADELQLHSVPYSYYSQYAIDLPTDTVTTDHILNGTITEDDLSQTFLDFIDQSMSGVSQADLEAHKTAVGDHTASVITVDNTFSHASGSTLQGVLETLDDAVSIQEEDISDMEDDITNLETTLNNLDGDLQTHINTDINDAHPGEITSLTIQDGTITTSDLDTTSFAGWDTDASDDVTDDETTLWDKDYTDDVTDDETTSWDKDTSNDLTTSTAFGGDVSGTYNDLQITNDSHSHDHGSLTGLGDDDHTQYLLANGGRSYSGDLSASDPGSCTATAGNSVYENDPDCLTVDGVDPSELADRVAYLADNEDAQPQIIAAGKMTLDGSADTTPNFSGYGIDTSSSEAGNYSSGFIPVSTGGVNDGYYRIYFDDAVGGDYVVAGNLVYSSDQTRQPRGPLVVVEQTNTYFVVVAMSGGTDSDADADFRFTVTTIPN